MNKRFGIYTLIWALLLVAFNAVCFGIPGKTDSGFWTGYIGITLAFIGQLVCACVALKSAQPRKIFYRIPLITVSYAGLIVTVVCGALTMALPGLPNRIGILVCALVLLITAIAVIKAWVAADLVEAIDEKTAVKTEFMKGLTAQASALRDQLPCEETKNVYEALRYADTVDHAALAEYDTRLMNEFRAFTDAVNAKDEALLPEIAASLIALIRERNDHSAMCK